MKKKTKIALGGILALLGIITLSGCTKSFCSNTDLARAMYAYEPGTTKFDFNEGVGSFTYGNYEITNANLSITRATFDETKKEFFYTNDDGTTTYLNTLNSAIKTAKDNGLVGVGVNQLDYLHLMDDKVLEDILKEAASKKEGGIVRNMNNEQDRKDLLNDISLYSYMKFVPNDGEGIFTSWDNRDKEIRTELGDENKCLSTDFINIYKGTLSSAVSSYRTCQTTVTGKYNTYTYSDGVYVTAKDWGYAWSKGFFEGLLVYPIGWLVDQIAVGFSSVGAGYSALLSIFFVTLIIRGLMMLVTIKQTNGNAKMTELQPEITKIQNKYPNANTNKYEKNRMAEEINALYKKNKINPLSTILVLIIQFPVFICVWGALSGSAILTNGEVFGHLSLGITIKDALFNGLNWTTAGGYSAVSALFLFIVMSLVQTVSMLLPQWMQKAKAKKVARLGKNPAQKSQDNKMKWVTYIMLVVIIIMGFSLVSAMGVYWLVGAIISIAQTVITQVIMEKKNKKKRS